jgi:predicted ATP-dependent serine protease
MTTEMGTPRPVVEFVANLLLDRPNGHPPDHKWAHQAQDAYDRIGVDGNPMRSAGVRQWLAVRNVDGGSGLVQQIHARAQELRDLEAWEKLAAQLPFQIHRASEAMDPLPPVDWIVEGLLSSSSTSVFAGDSGVGKTYAMLDLGVAVAAGQDWLGFSVVQGPVLFIDEENGERRLKRRLAEVMRGHNAPADLPFFCISFAGIDLRNQESVDQLAKAVELTRARLVILDSMMDFTPGADENSVKDMQPAYHHMRLIADEHSCHVAGVTGQAV